MKIRSALVLASLPILGLLALRSTPAGDEFLRPAAASPPRSAPDVPAARDDAVGSATPRGPGVVAAPPVPEPGSTLVLRFEGDAAFRGLVVLLDDRLAPEREDHVDAREVAFEGLAPGKKEIVLYDPPFAVLRETIALPPGRTEHVLAVPAGAPTAVLEGRLLDAGGFPIPAFGVSIRTPAAAAFDGRPAGETIAAYETFVGAETLLGLSSSPLCCRLEGDGWITSATESDAFGRFQLIVPASIEVPVEVRIAGRGMELLRPMNRPRPEFEPIDEDRDEDGFEDLSLDEVPTAFPGFEPADRSRYAFALLGCLAGPASPSDARGARDAFLAWIEGLEPTAFGDRIDALARARCAAVEGASEPDAGELVLDLTEREAAIRDLVILVRAMLDDLEDDRDPAHGELLRTLEILEAGE